jgi:hypothetical protein
VFRLCRVRLHALIVAPFHQSMIPFFIVGVEHISADYEYACARQNVPAWCRAPLRVEVANNKLATEVAKIDDIAFEAGYEDPTSVRCLFKRNAGLTPAVYRKKFASIGVANNV